jgi:hypothetical protein
MEAAGQRISRIALLNRLEATLALYIMLDSASNSRLTSWTRHAACNPQLQQA